jgi:cation:H+ antiporter
MTGLLFELAIMLVVILVAAELFTNALEHLGERLKISEGVTGSLFAAVGTALPETLVPLLAIAGGTTDSAKSASARFSARRSCSPPCPPF